MDIISEDFKDRAIIRRKTPRCKCVVALTVIKRCKELGKRIWGIDAFIIGEHWTQPVMEHSIDYSLSSSLKCVDDGYWFDSLNFMQNRADKGLALEIVCEE